MKKNEPEKKRFPVNGGKARQCWRPVWCFLAVIKQNRERGCHYLCAAGEGDRYQSAFDSGVCV